MAYMLRPEVEEGLIRQVREKHPEYSKLSAADIIYIALTKLTQ
jgi:hypothetical protein